ncbi:MAG: hypothetical protein MI799_02210, partial [Desulfobacterales bacterium]|nr:hypothetical protein [Desulfobacterales bacterium]
MSSKLISILFFTFFFIAALILEFIRKRYLVPVTIMDILLFPLSVLIIVYSLKQLVFRKNKETYSHSVDDSKLKLILYLCFSLIVLAPLGLFTLWMGIQEPLGFFSGIKGPAHGYTLIPLGIVITGLG